MSVLCPHKQRAGLQRERPCCGKTEETAAASPAAENQMKTTLQWLNTDVESASGEKEDHIRNSTDVVEIGNGNDEDEKKT